MAKVGVNVPPGVPVFSLADVQKAIPEMADEAGEVWAQLAGQQPRARERPSAYITACSSVPALVYMLIILAFSCEVQSNAWARAGVACCMMGPRHAANAQSARVTTPACMSLSMHTATFFIFQVVIKSQILAGGRGLGKFTNGLQGGVHIAKADKALELAKKMLGGTLVTKQTGPAGKPVNVLYVAKKMKLKREMYFAILLDRKSAGPMMIGCSEGGTSIEDLAEKFPEKIVKIPIDIRQGITDAQAMQMVEGLKVTGDKAAAAEQIKALYNLFAKHDCTMVEVSVALWLFGLPALLAVLPFSSKPCPHACPLWQPVYPAP